jgi:hypothetical protein
MQESKSDESERIGLCATCEHARRVTTPRDTVFYRCERARTDASFAKYPRLPVRLCAGYEPKGVNPRPR